jgi:prepilin-type processing-associated H-X9-DG protein
MSRSAHRGASLVEILIVVGIIAFFIGLLLPATRRVRGVAARAQCQNNLKQLMMGLHSYEATGKPASPSASQPDVSAAPMFPPGCIGRGIVPEERLSWMVPLLPYVEQAHVWQQFDIEKGFQGNLPAAGTRIKTFVCPESKESATNDAVTNYVAMAGIGQDSAAQAAGTAGNGFMGYDRLTSLSMIAKNDGTSFTIALMETSSNPGPWARGGTSNLRGFDPAVASLNGDQPSFGCHSGGINAAMADGSVRFIRNSIDPMKLAAAITIAGGEPFDLD